MIYIVKFDDILLREEDVKDSSIDFTNVGDISLNVSFEKCNLWIQKSVK